MGTFNNILVELQDVEPLDRIGYREEQFHKLVDLLNKTESKLNYLTYSSNTPQLVKSLLNYVDERGSWESEPHRLAYWNWIQNQIVVSYGVYKQQLKEERLEQESFENR